MQQLGNDKGAVYGRLTRGRHVAGLGGAAVSEGGKQMTDQRIGPHPCTATVSG